MAAIVIFTTVEKEILSGDDDAKRHKKTSGSKTQFLEVYIRRGGRMKL